MKEILKHRNVEKDAFLAYAVFDPGRKGHFSIRQLRDAFMINCRATPLEMADIFRMADPDLDGKVKEEGEYFSFGIDYCYEPLWYEIYIFEFCFMTETLWFNISVKERGLAIIENTLTISFWQP